MLSPQDNQKRAQQAIGYGAIWLHRIGDYAVVKVEIEGKWIEVIRERLDSNFSHCVHPVGIEAAYCDSSSES